VNTVDHSQHWLTQDPEYSSRHALPVALGAALRAARQSRRLSTRGLADEIGIGHSHLAAMERGTRAPSEHVAYRLVEVLDLTPGVAAWLVRESRSDVGLSR
jgi:transcriptional regulator with XRE-family HTH domain